MVVVGDPATHNEKEIKTRYPITEGLTAGTTKQKGKKIFLEPQKSYLTKRETQGL